MAVDPSDDHDQLPCGTSADALLDHLRKGTVTGHERTCPHCRAAAEEFRPLLAALDSEGEITAPPGLLDDVMRTVRAEGVPGRPSGCPAAAPATPASATPRSPRCCAPAWTRPKG